MKLKPDGWKWLEFSQFTVFMLVGAMWVFQKGEHSHTAFEIMVVFLLADILLKISRLK